MVATHRPYYLQTTNPNAILGSFSTISSIDHGTPESRKAATINGFVRVDTSNNMPTAAGLSSSSSGLSALVKACNAYFQTGYQTQELAQLAKFASGSSARSFFGPLAAWDKDSGAIYPVKTDLKLAMIMLVLHDEKKPISSRDGMELCAKKMCIRDRSERN